MNIDNLREGQVIKNYKELCSILGEKVKDGKSKRIQLEKLSEAIEYHKEGNKFVIDRIIKNEVDMMDKRKLGNNNTQARGIRYSICNLLSNYKIGNDEVIGFSKYMLLKKLNMVNMNYKKAKCNKIKYAKALNVSVAAVDEFLNILDNNSLGAIKKAINVLRTQSVLGYKYSFTWVDINGHHHHCITIEENYINAIEQEVMKELKIDNKVSLYKTNKWHDFKSEVVSKLKNNNNFMFKDIKYYYNSFHFNYNYEGIQSHMRYMEQKQSMTYNKAKDDIKVYWSNSLDKSINTAFSKLKTQNDDYLKELMIVKTSLIDLDVQEITIQNEIINKYELDVPF